MVSRRRNRVIRSIEKEKVVDFVGVNGDGSAKDWFIMYEDPENSAGVAPQDGGGGTYLIYRWYLRNEKVPQAVRDKGYVASSTGPTYCGFWYDPKNGCTANHNLQTAFDNTKNKSFFTQFTNLSSEDNAAKMSATLLDPELWKGLLDGTDYANKGVSVIGSPTVELWIKAWNKKYFKNLLYSDSSDIGYRIGTSPDSMGSDVNEQFITATEGYKNQIFYNTENEPNIVTTGEQSPTCYWLTGPSTVWWTDFRKFFTMGGTSFRTITYQCL